MSQRNTKNAGENRNKQVGRRGGGRAARLGKPVEKAEDFRGTLRKLVQYVKPFMFLIIIVFIMAALSTLFTVISPIVMGLGTTKIMEGLAAKAQGLPSAKIDFIYIRNIVFLLGGLYILSAGFKYLQQYIMVGVTQDIIYNLRKDVDEKLAILPLSYFDGNTIGDIMSRVTNDIDTISSTLQQSVTQLITAFVSIIGILGMMLYISPSLTLITFITIPLSILLTKGIAKRSQVYFRDQSKGLGDLNGHIEEMYTGHRIIKVFGREDASIEEFKTINEDLYEASYKAQFISGVMMPLMQLINNIGYVFVSVVGGIFVIGGKITIGNIQAFIQYSKQFTQPIVQTAEIANVIQSTIASAERVFQVLDEVEEIANVENPIELKQVKGRVKFEGVDFGYVEDELLIENLNIDIEPGQVVAIVGPTGAGKTTLVNLLMRFYEIDNGNITIDGIDINHMERGKLRSIFGMVLQDTWLFNGSIRDNIAYGRQDASDEEICEAAKFAQADHFIRTLPDGYDTILNEEASNISQGQKQLLTIARAILADPRILILDEATSSVDTRTEIHIQRAMTRLMEGRTSFVIAHRLSTIKNADIILVMVDGNIVEKGNHDQLMSENGFYSDLYNSQFSA